MNSECFVIKARWVVTMEAGTNAVPHAPSSDAEMQTPTLPSDPPQILTHAALVVENGIIIGVFSQDSLPVRYANWPVVDCQQHVLIPGLINTHAHSSMTLLKGYADDYALMPWLNEHIWPAEKQWVSPSFVHDGTMLACAEMLSGGITTFNDMYFFPKSSMDAVCRMGMRAQIGLVVMEFATQYANTPMEYIRLGTDARDAYKHHSLLSFAFAPHAPYTVSDHTFEQLVTYAAQLNLGLHTHLHETEAEISDSLAQYGLRPLARLHALGAIGPNTVLAHGVHLTDAELALLSSQGAHIAHCPSSNLKLASGIAPIAQALRAGVNVSLGTDGSASNNRLDIWQEMRTCALIAKVKDHNAASVSAYQALAMATIHGARALGLQDKIGTLTVGKQADVVAIRLDRLQDLPCFDPISHLVYVASREQVTHTWVQGQLQFERLENGRERFAQVATDELVAIAQQWQLKLQSTRLNA